MKILDCPFCGHKVDMEDSDTLYPSGTFWYDTQDVGRVYFGRSHGYMKKEHGVCWSMNCVQHAGGCGAEITGDSREHAIELWQRRVSK